LDLPFSHLCLTLFSIRFLVGIWYKKCRQLKYVDTNFFCDIFHFTHAWVGLSQKIFCNY
jgi:hypothetical protein